MTSSLLLLVCLTASVSGFLLDATPAPSEPLQLTYFDMRGRGEISRLLFAAAKKPYLDIRVPYAEWPAMKPTTPYGHLPLLNVSGQIFTQSLAIQNYIAKVYGLYPQSALDQLMCDQISFNREDLHIAEVAVYLNRVTDLAAANQTLVQTTIPLFLGNFNKYIKENPSKSGWVIGDKLSVADIVMFEGTQDIMERMPSLLDPYPEIKTLRAKVAASDGIIQYLATRPSTYPPIPSSG